MQGVMTPAQLERETPWTATRLVSFGLCGGLRPGVKVGESLIASSVRTPEGTFPTHNQGVPWFSDGKFNQANTPEQKSFIYLHTGAWAIDDESYSVAMVAQKRKIPFSVARVVSDAWNDDVSFTSAMLSPSGGINYGAVATAVLTRLPSLLKTWKDYNTSMDSLRHLGSRLSPDFNLNRKGF